MRPGIFKESKMSVLVKYPNGKTAVVSDEVAAVLEKRPGHELIRDVKPSEKKAEKK